MSPVLRPVGADGVLVECADAVAAAALAGWLAERLDPPPAELVPAAATVLVVAPGRTAEVAALVAGAPAAPGNGTAGTAREHAIAVRYDGPDLAAAAAALGMSPQRLAAEHAAAAWRVDFIGFAPGFGYCRAPDWPHRVPRLPTPRERVPVGAVAIADGFTAVYPRATPGGWRIIGTTSAPLWDERREPPALLAAGDLVRFSPEGAS